MTGALRRLRAEIAHQLFKLRGRRAKFEEIHRRNLFGGDESASGPGSTAAATATVARELERLVRRLGVRTLLDAPCGDFNWMRGVDLGGACYVGADIVEALVVANRERHGAPGREFVVRDLVCDRLPAADLVLSRDCLVHLSNADALRALRNVAASGAGWLLATTFPGVEANADIVTGQWRPVNLERPPFSLPPPEETITEGCTERGGRYADKALGLWSLERLRARGWGA